MRIKESVTYQAILEEGEAIGITKRETREALAEAKKLVLIQGTNRFGPTDARALTAMERVTDLSRLEELGVHLLGTRDWDGPLDRPAPRRRS